MRTLLPLLLLNVLFTYTAFAQDIETELSGFYVAPTLHYQSFADPWIDNDQLRPDAAVGLGLGLGYQLGYNWAVELAYQQLSTTNAFNDADTVGRYLHVDGLYDFRGDKKTIWPYLVFGIGQQSIKPDDAKAGNDGQLNGGVGFKYQFAKRWLLRSDVRMTFANRHNDLGALLNIGLVYNFFEERQTEESIKRQALLQVDSDQDGIPDINDKCPATKPEALINEVGCEEALAEVLPSDDDGDSVINEQDLCPATEEGISVDTDGCALDTDEDGVPDSKDLCPGSRKGFSIGEDGCYSRAATISFELDINFASGSDQLTEDSKAGIDELLVILKANPLSTLVIEGYTDSVGSAKYNKQLSQKRANSVRRALMKEGIAGDRISSYGLGEENPIADNNTEEGRAKNRRVVVEIKQ